MSLGGDVELVVVGWVGENVSWVLARRSSCGSYHPALAVGYEDEDSDERREDGGRPLGALHDASGHGEHDSCGSAASIPVGIGWTGRNASLPPDGLPDNPDDGTRGY